MIPSIVITKNNTVENTKVKNKNKVSIVLYLFPSQLFLRAAFVLGVWLILISVSWLKKSYI